MRQGIKVGEAPTLGIMRRELLELVRHEGDILADIRVSLDRVEGRSDRMKTGLRSLEHGVDGLSRQVDCLRRDLPAIVGEAVREAFRDERERKR